MGSFDQARPLGSYSLEREGNWALSTWERDSYGAFPSRGHARGMLRVLYTLLRELESIKSSSNAPINAHVKSSLAMMDLKKGHC